MPSAPPADLVSAETSSEKMIENVKIWLDDAKAENVIVIDLSGKSSIADYMVIASGRSNRHVSAIIDQIQQKLKENGVGQVRVEGKENCDWVLLDTGDLIVHVFRPEVRDFYNLEKMWQGERPADDTTAH